MHKLSQIWMFFWRNILLDEYFTKHIKSHYLSVITDHLTDYNLYELFQRKPSTQSVYCLLQTPWRKKEKKKKNNQEIIWQQFPLS